MLKAGILTVSDKGASGQRVDKSGEVIRELLSGIDSNVVDYDVVPDEMERISGKLAEWSDSGAMDLILTSTLASG